MRYKGVGRSARIVGCVVIALMTLRLAAQPIGARPPPHPDRMGIATVTAVYSCEDASNVKLDSSAYASLSSISGILVDAQLRKCDLAGEQQGATPEHPARESTVVVFANPAATNDNDKVFYGLAKSKDLKDAQKTCAGVEKPAEHRSVEIGQVIWVALEIEGAVAGLDEKGGLGTATYNFSDARCRGLTDAAETEIVFIGPNAIVTQAKSQGLVAGVSEDVPLISGTNRNAIMTLIDASKSTAHTTRVLVNSMGSVITTRAGKVFIPHPRVEISAPKI